MKISILGGGAFGTAMASHLARKGHNVSTDSVSGSEIIFVCVPAGAVADALEKIKEEITGRKIVICSKGFAGEGKLLSEVLKEKFAGEFFFLYGPALAEELKDGKFSGMVLAGGAGKEEIKGVKNLLIRRRLGRRERDYSFTRSSLVEIKKEIESETLRIELSDDAIGAEVGAALKNVMAILIGIAEGAGWGQNAAAFVFTRGAQEIKKIGLALGAQADTFLGLSCAGDLTLLSRNRRLGVLLGQGRKLDDAIKEMNYVPEGIPALQNAKIMVEKIGLNAPLIKLLYEIIFENYPISQALDKIK